MFCKLAVAISAIWSVAVVSAAEITVRQTVVLEGQIEPGDYDKLRDNLLVERDSQGNGVGYG